jgi:hypothetical protein
LVAAWFKILDPESSLVIANDAPVGIVVQAVYNNLHTTQGHPFGAPRNPLEDAE